MTRNIKSNGFQKTNLSFDAASYSHKDALMKESEKDLRKEYSRLRSIARKRLERMGASKYASESKIYKEYRNKFAPVVTLKSKGSVATKLVDLKYYLDRQTGSVSGYKKYLKDLAQSFNDRGWTWVTPENVKDVTDWLSEAKSRMAGDSYDSERVVTLYREAQKQNLDLDDIKEDFAFWINHRNDIGDIPKKPNGKSYSPKTIKTMLEKEKNPTRKPANRGGMTPRSKYKNRGKKR